MNWLQPAIKIFSSCFLIHTVCQFFGRPAPARPGADLITREAYSQEVASCGFWPGGGQVNGAAFYAYAAPEPEGYSSTILRPADAFYNPGTGGCVLMCDKVRNSNTPNADVEAFFQTSYEACANLGHWDREALEHESHFVESDHAQQRAS